MASSSNPRIEIFKADGAIAKGKAVKAGSDKDHVAVASAATDKIIGWAQNAAVNAGDKVEVALHGGGAKCLAGGNVAMGDVLTSDASGQAIATTTNADRYAGVAMQSAVAGDIFYAEVSVGIV